VEVTSRYKQESKLAVKTVKTPGTALKVITDYILINTFIFLMIFDLKVTDRTEGTSDRLETNNTEFFESKSDGDVFRSGQIDITECRETSGTTCAETDGGDQTRSCTESHHTNSEIFVHSVFC
jgi:hypothetical protein